MSILQQLVGVALPIVQAPMAGVQGSVLAVAVCKGGGLGSLPCAMLESDADARADGRGPSPLNEDEEIVCDFSTGLLRNNRVCDRSFDRAEKRFGKRGVVDLTGIPVYYTFLATQLNAARHEAPKDARKLMRFPQ
jgi:NAD(P)H-dependent flavin oxidoreductase YrpB (nitropropane dioxygenase family)